MLRAAKWIGWLYYFIVYGSAREKLVWFGKVLFRRLLSSDVGVLLLSKLSICQLKLISLLVILSSVNEYINSGLNDAIVDPDPELIYTKRKLAREQTKSSKETVPSTSITSITTLSQHQGKVKVNYPMSGWGISLQKMPFFSRAEMDKYVSRTGKSLGCAGKKSVPTGHKKAATFLKDEYLKEIESHDDQRYFFMRCKCYHSFRKNDPPHNIFLALCIVSGDVEDSKCTCVAGSLGYCNHSLALMLKACKFSLYGSQNTKDLENESDQIPGQACTSKLQTWHQKGRGETIYPHGSWH